MGGGISIHNANQGKPTRKSIRVYENAIHDVVASECKQLADSGLTGAELEAQLTKTLLHKENILRSTIIQKAKSEIGKDLRIIEKEIASESAGLSGNHEKSDDLEKAAETFKEICTNTIDNIRKKNQYRWLVGLDGSEHSRTAYESVLALRKKIDSVSLFYAYDDKHKADMLQQEYDVSLTTAAVKPQLYNFWFKNRENQTVEQSLIDLLEDLIAVSESPYGEPTPDFFVCGSSHTVQQGFEKTTLGSVADLALRRVHLPIIIIKQKIPLKGPKKYIMAVDGSEYSKNGLDILLTLTTPKDILRIVHVCGIRDSTEYIDEGGSNTIAKIKEYYENEIDLVGPVDSKVLIIPTEGGQTEETVLIDYVNNEKPDFLAMAPRVQMKNTSFTEQIMYRVYTNIILCKT